MTSLFDNPDIKLLKAVLDIDAVIKGHKPDVTDKPGTLTNLLALTPGLARAFSLPVPICMAFEKMFFSAEPEAAAADRFNAREAMHDSLPLFLARSAGVVTDLATRLKEQGQASEAFYMLYARGSFDTNSTLRSTFLTVGTPYLAEATLERAKRLGHTDVAKPV